MSSFLDITLHCIFIPRARVNAGCQGRWHSYYRTVGTVVNVRCEMLLPTNSQPLRRLFSVMNQRITTKLAALKPHYFEVINESSKHNVPAGCLFIIGIIGVLSCILNHLRTHSLIYSNTESITHYSSTHSIAHSHSFTHSLTHTRLFTRILTQSLTHLLAH